ncbi:MAG: pyruvate formate lyase-activating protein [Spirochaetaceae bacterium]|nr:pyruvate formate lyase-activating protein [Spirochaetaceae bacterium]
MGVIHSTESFGSVDGPGIRFVVFMQGCPMACQYCHNPDTWVREGGTVRDAESVLRQALRCRSYWGDRGGLTVSGGEPLLQLPFILALFQKAKEQGIHTALDTSGAPFSREAAFLEPFTELLDYTDLVLLDLKHIEDRSHRQLTGRSNGPILDMARFLSASGKAMWIRHVLVPGITDDPEALTGLKAFIDTLKGVEKIEVLPYHRLGAHKWRALGRAYPLEGVSEPSAQSVQRAREILGAS